MCLCVCDPGDNMRGKWQSELEDLCLCPTGDGFRLSPRAWVQLWPEGRLLQAVKQLGSGWFLAHLFKTQTLLSLRGGPAALRWPPISAKGKMPHLPPPVQGTESPRVYDQESKRPGLEQKGWLFWASCGLSREISPYISWPRTAVEVGA